MNFVDCNNSGGVSSDNEPTWRICRKAVWMSIRNYNNLADVENVLNRQDDGHDLHIASAKCFVQLLTAIGTPENESRLDDALAECRRLESRCRAKTAGGWMREIRRRLFSSAAAGADDLDRQIALADVTVCIVGLTLAVHRDSPSVGTMARTVYALRRAWKMYQQCYAAVLNVYRNVYDLDADQNTPRWPPVLKRRQSVAFTSTSNIGSRMLRSATTSFEMLRQNSASNIVPKDVVRLMTAVSVGYGAFNLMISLLPPKIVSAIGMVGFRGDRQTGLDALMFAKNGPDVHAPLAWGILSWYRMMGNTDFMFDGPRSRENECHVNESEQLVRNPPEEFRSSTTLQYFTGRSCFLKGDIEGSIRAYETGSTIVEYCFVNMKAMYLHELAFMYTIRLDWMAACRKFASAAKDNVWMRPYHYFMATVCAVAAGDVVAAELMSRRTDETIEDGRRRIAERDMVGNFVADRKRTVADALQRTTTTTTTTGGEDDDDDDDDRVGGKRHCRLIVFEVLYVKYGTAKWPTEALHAVLEDCRENKNDNETTRYQKKLLTIVCRKALSSDGPVDEDHRRCLTEIVEQMERDKRRDHLYAYGLYELAAEQVGSIETVNDGKQTIQKLIDLKGPYNFQYFYEMRCASLQAYVQKLNIR